MRFVVGWWTILLEQTWTNITRASVHKQCMGPCFWERKINREWNWYLWVNSQIINQIRFLHHPFYYSTASQQVLSSHLKLTWISELSIIMWYCKIYQNVLIKLLVDIFERCGYFSFHPKIAEHKTDRIVDCVIN